MVVVQELCERAVIINRGRVVADERISNLLELFNTLTYEVSLAEPLRPEVGARLPSYQAGSDGLSFTVTLESTGQLYQRSEEHTSELQSRGHLVCRLLLEKKNT